MGDVYSLLANLLKYIFITIIYLFIFGIIRMISLDIHRMEKKQPKQRGKKDVSFLELVSDRKNLYFDVRPYYPLEQDQIVIGRGKDCTICIDDLYLSARHTRLWFDEGEWYIVDMGSSNGTYVNGERMDEQPLILDTGDRIRIGQLEFMIVIAG